MDYAAQLDFRRPASLLSLDVKHDLEPSSLFDDSDTIDDSSLLDASIMSPANSHRRDSFTTTTTTTAAAAAADWDLFPAAVPDRTNTVSTNPFYDQQSSNNPFTRLEPSQAASYGQRSTAQWSAFESNSGTCTPTTSKPFEGFPANFDVASAQSAFLPSSNGTTPFGSMPTATNVRPSSLFPSAASTPQIGPQSPRSQKEWMAMAAEEMANRPHPKRMRPNTPPPRIADSSFRRGDGIRKKNARFEIPAERSLSNIDSLIQSTNDDEEKKELKQQKRLLRNRQAALDSRQRKKRHTEELEEEKKIWATRMNELSNQIQKLEMDLNVAQQEKEHWRRQQFESDQVINRLNWEKEDLVRTYTLETGDLRKKVSVLSERLSSDRLDANGTAMSAAPSSFTDFATDMGNLHMTNEWDNFLTVGDDMEPEHLVSTPKASETALIVAPRKPDQQSVVSDSEKPVANGLLLMLLLCGAFVASKSSGGSAPAIPRMPDDVREASATVLDNIFKDAGVAPSPAAVTHVHPALVSNGFAPQASPSASLWTKSHQMDSEFGGSGNAMGLDVLQQQLNGPTKEQEAEQIFSMTPSQYNSLTSADFPSRHAYPDDSPLDDISPTSPSFHRRNLAEQLAALRDDSKGQSAADVYTRSLLWDKIPSDVVKEFKRMVEESNLESQRQAAEDVDCKVGV